MRGISRTSYFKSGGAEKFQGPVLGALSTLAASVLNASTLPVITNVDAVLNDIYNTNTAEIEPVSWIATNNQPSTQVLKNNLTKLLKNAAVPSLALVYFNIYASTENSLYVSIEYSKTEDFSEQTYSKGLTTAPNKSVAVFLDNLSPGQTYYIRIRARKVNSAQFSRYAPYTIVSNGLGGLTITDYLLKITTASSPTNGFFSGIYYINGQATYLPASGTGEWNGTYYSQGIATNLVNIPGLGWSGRIGDFQYYNAQLANGYFEGEWWYYGTLSSEFFFNGGNGWHHGLFYQDYVPFTGYYEGQWFGAGHLKPGLDAYGNGTTDQLMYYAGAPYTGVINTTYYINGEATTLGTGGTGTWNGQYYSGGAYVGDVGNPYDSGQTSSQGSRFSSGVTYG
jgi:hypothetical protein